MRAQSSAQERLFLVHQLGQMEQVFAVAESLLDFHALLVDLQARVSVSRWS